ncbi:MAG: RagB/SusD family nutrient uptake outer membrane protein [Bacteroidales bacterium]|nr:RagB/SusD family nutrient uptake outer membrane protein [Bacteroidales bacterium]
MAPVAASFASKNEALDSVYKERRLEMAFENQRWFDLLRMNKSYDNPDKAVEILKQHIFVTDWLILYGEYSKISLP